MHNYIASVTLQHAPVFINGVELDPMIQCDATGHRITRTEEGYVLQCNGFGSTPDLKSLSCCFLVLSHHVLTYFIAIVTKHPWPYARQCNYFLNIRFYKIRPAKSGQTA